ncbi:hypothetical protein BEN47_03830 [Hymenobacter lapidarius]|uniref:S9 family peptidase n=1 Tax=Hymenobacter lapidarius TaxID=1908237 RepID=A0A1G1SXT9_9BACT|nr:hypothetical protein [Hymenobacter lapidarius]OGX83427.1 hypothetical protein BEN47_03830 [Hymenobacter lapidarius]
MKKLIAFCCCLAPFLAAAQPNTDIYLFDLAVKGTKVVLSKPLNITPHVGYDNQPFFHPTQPLVYYTAVADSGRTDLRAYNYQSAQSQAITTTREREFSPTLTEDQQFLSCIIQRDNGNQDLGQYPLAGGPPTVLIDNLKVGYHAWIDRTRLLLFVLATPVNALHYHDLATGRDTVVARNIGRSIKRIPNQAAISFMQQTPEGTWLIQRFDTKTRAITTIAPGLAGSEDVAWTRNGLMLMSNGEQIYSRRPGARGTWQPVTIKGAPTALKKASRLAINAAADKLAVVVDE